VAEQRLSRKAIRQPDQFIFFSVQVIDWIKAHLRYLIYGALGMLVIAALLTWWSAWQKHREQQAEMALYEATKLMNVTTVRPTHRSQAIERFQKLVSDYGSTPAAAVAYWHLGHLYFEGGEYTAALAAYKQAQQRFTKSSQPLMLALVTLDVGYAQEASGACDQALTSFEAVLQLPAHWLRGEAYLGMGRCHESTGVPHKAVAIYERALSDGEVNEMARQAISEHLAFLQPRTKEQGQEALPANKP
jgi:predicted negative regulator of RcsB-dependent stress response